MKRWFLAAMLLAYAPVAFAQQRITPVPAIGNNIAEIARESGQMAEGNVTGGGRWLRIGYASAEPFVGFVAPMTTETRYNPVDMLRFDLPAAAEGVVDIDLSVSPSWSALPKTYVLSFSAKDGSAPEISGVAIVPATAGDSIGAFVRHAFVPEAFVVSTYHRLRGYRILGTGVAPALAVLLIVLAAGLLVWKRKAAAFPLLGLAFAAQLTYGARVDLDLARLTASHLGEWQATGEYGEAGDIYALADEIRELEGDVRLAVCFDSTDYFAKLLRYLLLPIPVQIGTDPSTGSGQEAAMEPTHVAVVRKIEWSYDADRLKCGSIDVLAELVEEFPDGSRLFKLL